MKAFDSGVQLILNALGQPTFCVLVEFEAGWRYTSWPSTITYGGDSYTSAVMTVRGLGDNYAAEAPAAALEVGSLDLTQQARFLSDSFRGTDATVTVLYLASGTWTATGYEVTYTCDADQVDADKIMIRLASTDAVQGTDAPRRATQEAGCPFDYRRGGCAYRGKSTSCDKGYDTTNGCRAHFPNLTIGGATVIQPKPYGGFLGGVSTRLRVKT